MKKIFTYLAVAALMAVACEGMYGPVETPTAPDQPGTINITVESVEDNGFVFNIAPVGETSYYSYFVAAGAAQEVDPTAVYQCKAGGIDKGIFKADPEVPQQTIVIRDLAPNSVYTIYAVAGSPQGIPGEVAVQEVTTTDGVAIAITSFSAPNDSTVVLSFSETVYLGQGEVTATYYSSVPSVAAQGVLAAESVTLDGSTATVTFAGLPSGAYFAVSYTEGTFTDSADNKISAFTSGYNAEKGKFAGVYSRKETAPVALDEALPEELQMFNDWGNTIFYVGAESPVVAAGEGAAKIQYVTPGKVTTIDLVYGSTYLAMQGMVAMVCPEAPAFGSNVVFTFEEDAFQDMWGNPTAAAEYTSLCAYNYTLEDVLGTYAFVAPDNVSQSYIQETFEIVESDDPESGNVMFTSLAGIPCQTPIYATFTPASGVLEIYGTQPFYSYVDEEGSQISYVFYTYNYDYLHLTMAESGVLAMPDDYFGVAIAVNGKLSSWGYLFLDFEAQKYEAEAAVATQSLSVKKFEKTLALNVR